MTVFGQNQTSACTMEQSDQLGFAVLKRAGSTSVGSTRRARVSVDFTVNGVSLLLLLAKGSADMMGCFVQGLSEANGAALVSLLGSRHDSDGDGRTLLYLCPECGDIGCGAYAVNIKANEGQVTWSDFAYVNGYGPASPLLNIGPFRFDRGEYLDVVERASRL